jgi:protein tyrosine/serine phosphatase
MEDTTHSSPKPRRRWWVRALGWFGALVLFLVVLFGGGYLVIQWDNNFHIVDDHVLYRSAQLSGDELKAAVQKYGIRTVLNLRGENKGADWYDEEMQASKQCGLNHIDIGLSAREQLTVAQMQELIKILETSPRPILVHCGSGTDRTGLVCSLFRLAKGQSSAMAGKELSLKYGHFPYLGSDTDAMDKSLEIFTQSQAQR